MSFEEGPSGVYRLHGWGDDVCIAFSTRRFDNAHREDFLHALSLPPQKLVMVKQVHGDAVLWVDRPLSSEEEALADGLVTTTAGLVLGVRTADCVPVFFYDSARKAVGIAHAGWKGIQAGIIQRMLKIFLRKLKTPAESLRVALGPSIRECCYEVGKEFLGYFPGFYRQKNASKGSLDLIAVIRDRLVQGGVLEANFQDSELCTVCENQNFFSYRAEGCTKERILSVICLKS